MRKLESIDERLIAAAPASLYPMLVDFREYQRFWPADSEFKVTSATDALVGSRAVCSLPKNRGRFDWVLESAEPNQRIGIRHDGLFRGRGTWTFAAEQGGTRLRFAVDLEIVPLLGRILSHVIDVQQAHSSFMQRVFDGLAREAAARQQATRQATRQAEAAPAAPGYGDWSPS